MRAFAGQLLLNAELASEDREMLRLSRVLISSTRSSTIIAGLSRRQSFKPTSCMLKQQLSTSSLVHGQQDTLPEHVFLGGNSPETYANFLIKRNLKIKELLESPTRFQKISEREERSDIPANLSLQFSLGKNLLECGGICSLTGALDVAIYSHLFWLVKPGTVFELGALFGGSALSIASTLKMQGSKGHVYSIDLDLSLLDPRVKDLKPDNLTFVEGDMYKIEEVLPLSKLESLPHPWVLIEDAHANSLGVLEHFHKFMKEGDYIVYDDTDPVTPLKNGMGWEGHPTYEPCGFEKLHMLKEFMIKYDGYYCVDSYLTDLFGYNATNNWNGYVRRMK